ncbi:MAG TPA: phosphotransferase, partial [Bacilli bacterium]|nr:phosphotransferase [Bacilli bacterium]
WAQSVLSHSNIKKTASLYGLTKEELKPVGGFENYIYGFDKEEKSYIARISHSSHRTIDEVKSEMDFLYYLARNGANVSMPIYTLRNQLVEQIDCRDGSYFIVCAFTKAEGEAPSRQSATDKLYYNYGKTIGMFHRLTKDYKESEGIKRRFTWDEDLIIKNAHRYLPKEDEIILKRLNEVVASIKEIETHKDNFGLIHTDVHFGNFFVKDDQLTVFDFDDCAYHYFASDIAIALYYLIYMVKAEEQYDLANRLMANFMKGYLEENNLPKKDYLTIPFFLKLRELILYIVIHRTLNVKENRFAQVFINRYRDRIINNIPLIDLDFEKYYI